MRKHTLKLISMLALLVAAAFLVPQSAIADDDDPPTRVARLSHVDGSVSFEPAGTDDWVTAVLNRPMTTGDKLWADRESRAELHIGSASIRLGSSTGFSFLNLDDDTVQIQLTEGTLRIRVRRLDRNDTFEVDTPNLAFSVLRPGVYRISVNEAGDTTVVNVRDGDGEVTGGGESYAVHADETGTFTGADQLQADIVGRGNDDDLERWSAERDRRDDHATARRYVSDDVIGYEDLDEYGGWRDVPEYGTVWFPHVTVAGWAPYRYGHWVWIEPWGYTWVDDEPWGFAPFHYGRWVAVRGVWGWVPCRPRTVVGVAYVRPVYAPALVAWVGGPRFAVGVAVGGASSVGWFPLGPREVYVPSYRVSRTYVNNVNISNTTVNTTVVNNYYNTTVVNNTTVTNVRYVNQGVPGAVTATSTRVFTTSQPVARNVMRVDERELARAPVASRTPTVTPERQAFIGAGRPVSARPPERIVTRGVVARRQPPPPPPSVERQQAAIRETGGHPVPPSQLRQIEQQQVRSREQVRIAPPARQPAPQNNADNRPGQPLNNRPGQQPSNVQPNRPANNERSGTSPVNIERPNNGRNDRNDRPISARPNPISDRPNTPPPNVQPNRQPGNDRLNTPPPNAAPNRPADNVRPGNERNDRPSSARPPSPSERQMDRRQQQDMESLRRQQDQERQRVERQQEQEHQRAAQQRADDQRKQQMEQQHERQLQDLERKHDQDQQRVQQRQQQERQQSQQQQQQQRPPQAERQQPPPRQQQQERPKQQERSKQQDRSKDKDKDKPPKL